MWRCTTFCMILMWLSLYMGKDLIRKTLLLPHNCQPGYRITSIPFWGQTYSLHGEPEAKYFSVTSSGDVITNSDIGNLLGRHITLIINNDLASEQWTEEVHITIGDGNTILQFPHNHYNGEINEHVPVGTMVAELDDLFAHRGVSFDDSISYELVSSAGNFPFRLQQDGNLSNAVRFITTSSLDKIRKDKYEVQVMAKSRDDTAIASVLILVTSDKQPKFLSPEYHVVISENTPTMSTITQLKPLNPNFKGKLHYSMEPHGLFKLNPSSGHLILRSRTMLEPLTYHLQVEAEDSAGQKGTPATVVVEVETMEDDTLLRYTPHSELSPHSRKRRAVRATKKFEVPESLSGELIRLSDDSHERFAFVDTPPAMLEINRETGAVRLRNGYRLDYEDTPNIHFNVVVTKTNNREGMLNYLS